MAQPGETFPQEFALGILQLAQQRKIRQAELSEMRSTRAANNFIEQERLQLAERAQSLNEFQAGTNAELQKAQAEVQKEAQFARIKLEAEKIKMEREGQVTDALHNFGRTGSAFIPSWASDKIPQLTSSSSEFGVATVQIPGLGTLVQRVNDPKLRSDLAETDAKIDLINQQRAVASQRTKLLAEQTAVEQQKARSAIGSIGGPEVIGSMGRLFDNMNDRARQRANSLQFSDKPEDQALSRRILLDPSEAYKDSPEDLKTYTGLRAGLNAVALSVAQGLDVNKIPTNLQNLDALGLSDAVIAAQNFSASQAPPETVVGRLTGPNASGQVVHKVVLSSGRTVDVDEETYKKTKLGSPVGGAAPAPQAPLQAPAPSPGPAPEQRQQYKEELERLFAAYDAAPNPAQKNAIGAQINEIKKRLTQ